MLLTSKLQKSKYMLGFQKREHDMIRFQVNEVNLRPRLMSLKNSKKEFWYLSCLTSKFTSLSFHLKRKAVKQFCSKMK